MLIIAYFVSLLICSKRNVLNRNDTINLYVKEIKDNQNNNNNNKQYKIVSSSYFDVKSLQKDETNIEDFSKTPKNELKNSNTLTQAYPNSIITNLNEVNPTRVIPKLVQPKINNQAFKSQSVTSLVKSSNSKSNLDYKVNDKRNSSQYSEWSEIKSDHSGSNLVPKNFKSNSSLSLNYKSNDKAFKKDLSVDKSSLYIASILSQTSVSKIDANSIWTTQSFLRDAYKAILPKPFDNTSIWTTQTQLRQIYQAKLPSPIPKNVKSDFSINSIYDNDRVAMILAQVRDKLNFNQIVSKKSELKVKKIDSKETVPILRIGSSKTEICVESLNMPESNVSVEQSYDKLNNPFENSLDDVEELETQKSNLSIHASKSELNLANIENRSNSIETELTINEINLKENKEKIKECENEINNETKIEYKGALIFSVKSEASSSNSSNSTLNSGSLGSSFNALRRSSANKKNSYVKSKIEQFEEKNSLLTTVLVICQLMHQTP